MNSTQRETLKAFWLALIPEIHGDPSKVIQSPLGDELFYLFGYENPDITLLRWLRARKWDVAAAVQHMMDSLRWRHDWGFQKLMANGENDLNLDECASGKGYMMGKDKMNRQITYMHAREHTKGQYPFEGTEKFLILYSEVCRSMLGHPVEEGTVVMDLSNMTVQNIDYQHIRFLINTAQNQYPETLGLALMLNAPRGFNMVWRVIRPWMDPVVASKVRFVDHLGDLTTYIDPAWIPKRLGGRHADFEFIPASQEEQDRQKVIRQDKEAMEEARRTHREAAERYLQVTLKWASTQDDKGDKMKQERASAARLLGNAFTQRLPYISTRTYYHRTGQIREPIFDTVYERIYAKQNETTFF